MSKRTKFNLSKKTKLELNITSVIFIIELIIVLVVRHNFITSIYSGYKVNIDQAMTAVLAIINTFNIFYIMVLVIINTTNAVKSNTDEPDKIESKSDENLDENNAEKPE